MAEEDDADVFLNLGDARRGGELGGVGSMVCECFMSISSGIAIQIITIRRKVKNVIAYLVICVGWAVVFGPLLLQTGSAETLERL